MAVGCHQRNWPNLDTGYQLERCNVAQATVAADKRGFLQRKRLKRALVGLCECGTVLRREMLKT
jgi:hypothetical protein